MKVPRLTDEQIAKAKEWDVLDYMQRYEPDNLKKCGPHEFCTVEHGSLKISNGKWHWFSHDIGGKTALSYLTDVKKMDFVEAIELLCDGRGLPPPIHQPPEEKTVPFVLPKPARYATYAVRYLQQRGISPDIVSMCIRAGLIYESQKHHNCVFVGRDETGTAQFACMRGTYGDFRLDVAGSDKRHSFYLPAKNPNCTAVSFSEAPIDTLSVATLRKAALGGDDWMDCHYLSLGGTALRALEHFLEAHPKVNRVYGCVDNDEAGMKCLAKAQKFLESYPRKIEFRPAPPPEKYGKDYNEMLQFKIREFKKNIPMKRKQPVR
ncbi:MAG: DUF3991 and TOPRIM domain-containing protein [Ethanoligenens sp.]